MSAPTLNETTHRSEAEERFKRVQVTGRRMFDLSDDSIWTIHEYATAQELFRVLEEGGYTTRSPALATELRKFLAEGLAGEIVTTWEPAQEALALLKALNQYLLATYPFPGKG